MDALIYGPSHTDFTTYWRPPATCRSREVPHGRACIVMSPSAVRPKRTAGGFRCCSKTSSRPLRSLPVVKKVAVRWANGLRLDGKRTATGGRQVTINCWTATGWQADAVLCLEICQSFWNFVCYYFCKFVDKWLYGERTITFFLVTWSWLHFSKLLDFYIFFYSGLLYI